MRRLLPLGALLALACSRAPEPGWADAIERWHYTDPLPDLPLVNQSGDAISLADFRGAHLLVGFIYTTCPDAQACPMTTARMASIQRAWIERGRTPPLHLLSVTLDPARDTPAALTAYAATHGAELSSWTFATGEPALLTDGLPSLFNILALPDRDGAIDHTIKLALLDPTGRQVAEWKDNAVTAGDVFAAMGVSR